MIRHLQIKRFKRFRALDLSLGRLTLLTGLNGAGKTSVIHALLLARQASRPPVVALNGELGLSLGSAGDVLHRGASGESIELILQSDTVEAPFNVVLTNPDDRALYLTVERAFGAFVWEEGLTKDAPWFTYLSAERLGPRDTLSADSADMSALGVGVSGEYTAQVLALHDRQRVAGARLAPSNEEQLGATSQLKRQVERWMSFILGLRGVMDIEAEQIPNTTVTRLGYRLPGQSVEYTRPPNMGFGVSYVLPIVVAALMTPPGGLLIVENPEAHLHPAGQSAVGEFLARMAAAGVQVIVETHSDHVVNGVRRAVAEGKASLSPDEVVLYFFGGGGAEGDEVTRINLSATGELSAWPPGFFDQIENDLGAIARTRRRRS
jgi:predicted ATPase